MTMGQGDSRERELRSIDGLLDAAWELRPDLDGGEADSVWAWTYYIGEALVRSLVAIERQLASRGQSECR